MNQRQTDGVAALLILSVVGLGLLLSWDAYQQRQAADQMMGGMMGTSGMMGSSSTIYGTDPLVYLFGTLVVGALLAGGYVVLRSELGTDEGGPSMPEESEPPVAGIAEKPAASDTETESADAETDSETDESSAPTGRSELLDFLPEDERRVLKPVLESPGLTQIALRDRADFSKSKVSQTVSELEKRGLLYRERQGRTYRVYPSDDIETPGGNADA